MTFLIAAAGTGGHVYPGLAVGEALVDAGVGRDEIHFVGGDRLEATVYPEAGFPFLEVELKGLQRSLTLQNLRLPRIVLKARDQIAELMKSESVAAALCMGSYVTVPTSLAARRRDVPLMISEQNAHAGLAIRLAQRWSTRTFASFPETVGLKGAEWVGNPVRSEICGFDRDGIRRAALEKYGLAESAPVLGVFGGSLGAGALNSAVATLAEEWGNGTLQILHLTGRRNAQAMDGLPSSAQINWVRVPFEDEMSYFYGASDLIVARAGGAVAELTVTGSPSILVPGGFGSAGHQAANAAFLVTSGAAVLLPEDRLEGLTSLVGKLIFDEDRLSKMRVAAKLIARPRASETIAKAMIEAAQ